MEWRRQDSQYRGAQASGAVAWKCRTVFEILFQMNCHPFKASRLCLDDTDSYESVLVQSPLEKGLLSVKTDLDVGCTCTHGSQFLVTVGLACQCI